jgi:hypothetical protein
LITRYLACFERRIWAINSIEREILPHFWTSSQSIVSAKNKVSVWGNKDTNNIIVLLFVLKMHALVASSLTAGGRWRVRERERWGRLCWMRLSRRWIGCDLSWARGEELIWKTNFRVELQIEFNWVWCRF